MVITVFFFFFFFFKKLVRVIELMLQLHLNFEVIVCDVDVVKRTSIGGVAKR